MPAHRTLNIAPLFALALAGMAGLAHFTRDSVAVYPDTVEYVAAAQNLAEGRGLCVWGGAGSLEPITHYPPGLSLLLAGLLKLGVPALQSMRWINIVSLGATALLMGLLVGRCTQRRWPPLAATALAIVAGDMLVMHTIGGTEPPFLALSLASLLLVSQHLESGRTRPLIVAGLLAAAALLLRYVGAALVLTVVAAVLAWGGDSRARRLRLGLAFLLISSLPLGIALARNRLVGRTATDRQLAYNPLTAQELRAAEQTAMGWVLPPQALGLARKAVLLAAAGVLAVAWTISRPARAARSGTGQTSGSDRCASCRTPPVLGVFIVAYLGFVLVSRLFFDAAIALDRRLLLPVYAAVVPLGLCLALRALATAEPWGPLRAAAAGAVVLIVLASAQQVPWLESQCGRWKHYTAPEWRQSATIQWVRDLPPGTPVYSNAPDALWFLTGRPAAEIPAKASYYTRRPNRHYGADLGRMSAALARGGVVVLFDRIHYRWDLPDARELAAAANLTLARHTDDGAVYRVRGGVSAGTRPAHETH